jgi:hypothetical protein
MPKRKDTEKVSITVRLPRPVYNQAKAMVENSAVSVESLHVSSLNDLIVTALQSYIKRANRKRIDLAFQGMAKDAAFQKEAQVIASEFENSDWETLQREV